MGCTGNFPCQTFLDALSKMNSKDCVQPTYALDVTSSLRYFGILISQSNTCFFTNPLGQTCFQLFPTDLVMLHFCFRLEPGDFPTNLSQSGPGTNTLVHLDLLNASSKDKCILPAEQGIQHQFQLPMRGSDCPALPPQWKNGRWRIKHCKCV